MKKQIDEKYIINNSDPDWVKVIIAPSLNLREIRKQVKELFKEFYNSIPTRIDMLQLIFPDIKLDYTRESLLQIQDRFWDTVEPDENGEIDRFNRVKISSVTKLQKNNIKIMEFDGDKIEETKLEE